MTKQRTLVVGIGSPHGDDQVGWVIAEMLRSVLPQQIDVKRAATPSQVLDWLSGTDRLFVCDACEGRLSDASPAICQRWRWPTPLVASVRSSNSHSFGLPGVFQLAEQLGTLPDDVIVYGITGRSFNAFADISPKVGSSLQGVVDRIADEIQSDSKTPPMEPVGHA